MKISALAGMTSLVIVIKNRKFSQADHGPRGPMVAEAEILNKMWKNVERLTMGPFSDRDLPVFDDHDEHDDQACETGQDGHFHRLDFVTIKPTST